MCFLFLCSSAQVGQHGLSCRPSLNTETAANNSDKSNEKGLSRTRSLKFFRNKLKRFGSRFGKPKGPRSYPENWI
ncbi:hypothetical protein EYF80_061395 [Liparis tanakae]|uniref:Uncharacterized protein n=1 Tax=Liparis tanakae TaxID=230148 RepID=A0A4Z2EHZ4_9TELE|nr:hypothetical protein EYF80_061395 [Liparis tanakae]